MGRPKASKTRGPIDARVTYTVVYERNEHDGFTVTVPALPGLVTEGKDMKEAKAMVHEAGHVLSGRLGQRRRADPARGRSVA
jgi:predicted RNase H-like HicB family nuclease